MAYGAQLPIRLEKSVEDRLNVIAIKSGTTKSALIRLLASTFVDEFAGSDGSVTLPPNWSRLLPKADARSNSGGGNASKGVAAAENIVRKKRKNSGDSPAR